MSELSVCPVGSPTEFPAERMACSCAALRVGVEPVVPDDGSEHVAPEVEVSPATYWAAAERITGCACAIPENIFCCPGGADPPRPP